MIVFDAVSLFLFGSLGRSQAETNRRDGQHRWSRGSVHTRHNGYKYLGRFSEAAAVGAVGMDVMIRP